MIPRASRLPSREFTARDYATLRAPYFLLKTRRNRLSVNRLGIVIGNTAIARAADRNFWRRRIKQSFLEIPGKGFDILVVFYPKTKLPSVAIFKETTRDVFLSALLHL